MNEESNFLKSTGCYIYVCIAYHIILLIYTWSFVEKEKNETLTIMVNVLNFAVLI